MINFDHENDRTTEIKYNALLDLINKNNDVIDFQPKPFLSL